MASKGSQFSGMSQRSKDKAWAALPSHQKRRQAGHKGSQQYGSIDRYVVAGIRPPWYDHTNANPLTQYNRLLAHEKNQFEAFMIRSGRATKEQFGQSDTLGKWIPNRKGAGLVRQVLQEPYPDGNKPLVDLGPKKKRKNFAFQTPQPQLLLQTAEDTELGE